MAKITLPTDFQDDIMNSTMNGKRRYRMIQNTDGTISFEDVTIYDQVGNEFGAGKVNQTNQAVNESADKNKIINSLDAIRLITQPGYMVDALVAKEILMMIDDIKAQLTPMTQAQYNAASKTNRLYFIKG